MAAPHAERIPAGADKARAKGNASARKELSVLKDANGNTISAQTFTFRQLAAATRNFREECFIGEEGFGRVYKSRLDGSGQASSWSWRSSGIGKDGVNLVVMFCMGGGCRKGRRRPYGDVHGISCRTPLCTLLTSP